MACAFLFNFYYEVYFFITDSFFTPEILIQEISKTSKIHQNTADPDPTGCDPWPHP